MATVVNLGADPRLSVIDKGVSSGIENFFASSKKKEMEQKFAEAYRQVDSAPSYEDAVANIAKLDPTILSNPQVLEQLSMHIDRKFPEQEPMQVLDKDRNLQTIKVRKGQVLSDEELAKRGFQRPENSGVGTFFTFDEKTGDIGIEDKSTREEVSGRNPGRMVISKDEVGSTTSLMNAFTNAQEAAARKRAAAASADKESKPTQFDQEVAAIAGRLGLDITKPEDKNKAVRVHSEKSQAVKLFQPKFAKVSQTGEMVFTDDAQRGHVINAEALAEPAILAGASPEKAAQIMATAAYLDTATDPKIDSRDDVKVRAQKDFTRLTGIEPGNADLKAAMQAAEQNIPEGTVDDVDLTDAAGKVVATFRFVKLNGRAIPLTRIK